MATLKEWYLADQLEKMNFRTELEILAQSSVIVPDKSLRVVLDIIENKETSLTYFVLNNFPLDIRNNPNSKWPNMSYTDLQGRPAEKLSSESTLAEARQHRLEMTSHLKECIQELEDQLKEVYTRQLLDEGDNYLFSFSSKDFEKDLAFRKIQLSTYQSAEVYKVVVDTRKVEVTQELCHGKS